jgi:hypothetical protein
MLISADTLGQYYFILDFGLCKATIQACHNTTLDFVVTPKLNHHNQPRPSFAEYDITILVADTYYIIILIIKLVVF